MGTPQAIALGNLMGPLNWERESSALNVVFVVCFLCSPEWCNSSRPHRKWRGTTGIHHVVGTWNNDDQSPNRIPGSLSRVTFLKFQFVSSTSEFLVFIFKVVFRMNLYVLGRKLTSAIKRNNIFPVSTRLSQLPGGWVLPYKGHIGICCCEGYGFPAVYSKAGYRNQMVCI